MSENYMSAFMDGYLAAMAKYKTDEKKVLTVADIQERYHCGINKAQNIMQSILRCCNGGMLNTPGRCKPAEADYWDTLVDKQYKERL